MPRIILFFIIIISLTCASRLEHDRTIVLDDGLSYRYLDIDSGKYPVKKSFSIFYVQINPDKYEIDLLRARDYKHKLMTARDFANNAQSLLVINASFFDKKLRAIGLQIKKGKRFKHVARVDGGVFYIRENQAKICHTRNYTYHKNIRLAVQGLPRLVHNGSIIERLKNRLARRSFVGVTKDNQIILGVTMNSRAYIRDLAKILALKSESGGVGCHYALNLDGGSSTQLFMKHNGFKLYVAGSSAVPNALGIFPKAK